MVKVTIGELLNEDGSKVLLNEKDTITGADLESIPFELLSYLPLETALEATGCSYIVDGALETSLMQLRLVFEDKIENLLQR